MIWYVTNHYRNTQEGATSDHRDGRCRPRRRVVRDRPRPALRVHHGDGVALARPHRGRDLRVVRPFAETVRDGFFSWPQSLTLDNYRNAWEQGDIARKYWNTAVILVPLVLTLFFSSMVAFVAAGSPGGSTS